MTDHVESTESAPKGAMARKGRRGFWASRIFEARFLATRAPRLVKAARLGTFVLCLAALAMTFYARRVHSQLGERLMGAGELMMRYEAADHQDATRTMMVNGQPIMFSTGVTQSSVDEVLDNFESICMTHDGGVMEQFARQPERVEGHRTHMFDPVMRYGGANGGVVVCLDMGEEEVSLDELRARVRRFEASTDVHDIGNIRYVYVQQMEEPDYRHFITVWTNGSFRMGNMIADGGDAPGSTDLTDVPRPPGARRLMSAAEAGNPEAAVMYAGSPMTEWELQSFYERQLPEHGWVVTPVDDGSQPPGSRVVAAHSEDHSQLLFVSLDTDERGRGLATIAVSR